MLKRILLISSALCVTTPVFGQELPSIEQLQQGVRDALPGYWSVSDFRVVATSDVGDAAQPRRVVRFEADATPTLPLYVKSGSEGPFALVVPTETPEDIRTLYGVLDISYRAGQWSGPATVENPVSGLGQPISMFDVPTLEVGSTEAEEKLASIRAQTGAASLAAMESEIAAKQTSHQKALAELEAANAKSLTEIQGKQARDLANAQARLQEELASLQAKYRTEIAKLNAENTPRVAELQSTREKAVAAERLAIEKAVKELKAASAAELEALAAEHAKARGNLIATQNQQLAELETGLAMQRASLQRQVIDAKDVIALQQTLLVALAERKTGAAALAAAFEVERKERIEFLTRLGTEWSGLVRCTDKAAAGVVDRSFNAEFKVQAVRSSGLTGRFRVEGSSSDSEFVLADLMSFPLQFKVSWSNALSKNFGFSGFPMELRQDGSMVGVAETEWTIDRLPVAVTCNITLSS